MDAKLFSGMGQQQTKCEVPLLWNSLVLDQPQSILFINKITHPAHIEWAVILLYNNNNNNNNKDQMAWIKEICMHSFAYSMVQTCKKFHHNSVYTWISPNEPESLTHRLTLLSCKYLLLVNISNAPTVYNFGIRKLRVLVCLIAYPNIRWFSWRFRLIISCSCGSFLWIDKPRYQSIV